VLDGGLSNALEALGYDLTDPLWTARQLAEAPEAITKAHLRYLEAGAQCIITASYQATVPGFLAAGYSREQAAAMLRASVQAAEAAVERFLAQHPETPRPIIAASIGPYGAYLADGSEYRGRYAVSDPELRAFHEERLAILDRTNADCLACETLPSCREAHVLAELLHNTRLPAWLSFSCQDAEHLNDGTLLRECVAPLTSHPNLFALGVNCTAPRYISGLTGELQAAAPRRRIVVYPNSGEVYDAQTKQWHGLAEPERFGAIAQRWAADGVALLGGCCRIGPAHIRALRTRLAERA
jgi:homocysteine S-methyltransferase